jgi:hypothetical protein
MTTLHDTQPTAEPTRPSGPARSHRGLLAAVVGVLCVVGCAAGPLAVAGLAAAAGGVSGLWAVAAAGVLAGVVVVLRRRRRTC